MIEYTCTLIAVAVGSATVVALYYRICQPVTFWRVMASWHRSVGRHIANERYICDVRAGLARQVVATGATKPANAGKTVSDNGREYVIEKGGAA